MHCATHSSATAPPRLTWALSLYLGISIANILEGQNLLFFSHSLTTTILKPGASLKGLKSTTFSPNSPGFGLFLSAWILSPVTWHMLSLPCWALGLWSFLCPCWARLQSWIKPHPAPLFLFCWREKRHMRKTVQNSSTIRLAILEYYLAIPCYVMPPTPPCGSCSKPSLLPQVLHHPQSAPSLKSQQLSSFLG